MDHLVKVMLIKVDGGKKFCNYQVTNSLKVHEITMNTSMTYTPKQNGVVKRENRIWRQAGRTMLHSSNYPTSL